MVRRLIARAALLSLAAVLVMTAFATSAERADASAAGRLYAVDGAWDQASTLYELDPATGAVLATIGPTGFSGVSALDFDPTTGILYGIVVSWGPGPASSLLIQIDPETGVGTPIGTTSGASFFDISFDSSGTLYAWNWGWGGDALYTVDLTTGAGAKVGDCGCLTVEPGIAFDSSDTLYLKAEWDLWEIDTSTGQPVWATGIYLQPYTDDMLAIDANDVLYTGLRLMGSGVFILKTIDSTSGALAEVGTNSLSFISGLAFSKSNTKASVLAGSGVPGRGIDKAPGLQKEFNPNSKAAENAGKKK